MTGEPAGSEGLARTAYTGVWGILVRWFHVPKDPPTLPVPEGEHRESFKPAPPFLKYLKMWFWIASIIIDILLFVGWTAILVEVWWLGLLLLPLLLVLMIVPDVLIYVGLHLRYDTTWYVMTDRSLRIRRGIWIIHETTITFENVQNVKVTQGPIQRAFGISNLIVETAGGGGGGQQGKAGAESSAGIIEGVADAERLRDLILARLRQAQSAGLGDEEETPAGSGFSPAHLAVLREVREAAAAL